MNPLVRAQLASWAARYRTLAAAVLAGLAAVVAFPSVAPRLDDLAGGPVAGSPVAATVPATVGAVPTVPRPVVAAPTPTTRPAFGPGPTDAPPATTPGGVGLPPIAPPPPRPEPAATPCPVPLPAPEGAPAPLPLADVLNIAAPALPLLGPFVPFAVSGLSVVGPVLPVVTPALQVGKPVYVALGPLLANSTGPLVEFEALLLQPIAEPLAQYTPAMLDAEQAFIAQLQPLLEQAEATGAFDCGTIVVASVSGLVLDLQQTLGLDTLLDQVLGPVLDLLGGLP